MSACIQRNSTAWKIFNTAFVEKSSNRKNKNIKKGCFKAEYAKKELGMDIPTNYPLVGRDFNVTRAGIHADGLLKNEEIYNCFDTQKLLNRPPDVAITDKAGGNGVEIRVLSSTSPDPYEQRVLSFIAKVSENGVLDTTQIEALEPD
jgi:isopropylmalate/homocitrate/citramalate synthase